MIFCILCETNSARKSNSFLACDHCGFHFKPVDQHPPPELERERYETHENDVEDEGYQNFVGPLVEAILKRTQSGHKGLDFGCGTGPVATHLLQKQGYEIQLYDPYFYPSAEVFDQKFDFIFACEVVEHFYRPSKEFLRLRKMLKPGAPLFIQTEHLDDSTKLETWYYAKDPTHVGFYSRESMEWIQKNFRFSRHEQLSSKLSLFYA